MDICLVISGRVKKNSLRVIRSFSEYCRQFVDQSNIHLRTLNIFLLVVLLSSCKQSAPQTFAGIRWDMKYLVAVDQLASTGFQITDGRIDMGDRFVARFTGDIDSRRSSLASTSWWRASGWSISGMSCPQSRCRHWPERNPAGVSSCCSGGTMRWTRMFMTWTTTILGSSVGRSALPCVAVWTRGSGSWCGRRMRGRLVMVAGLLGWGPFCDCVISQFCEFVIL